METKFYEKLSQPEGRPTWQTLVATLRSLYNQVVIIIMLIIIIIIIFIFIFIIIITVIIIMKALPGTYLELLSAVSHPTPTSSPETSDVRLKKQVLIMIIATTHNDNCHRSY